MTIQAGAAASAAPPPNGTGFIAGTPPARWTAVNAQTAASCTAARARLAPRARKTPQIMPSGRARRIGLPSPPVTPATRSCNGIATKRLRGTVPGVNPWRRHRTNSTTKKPATKAP